MAVQVPPQVCIEDLHRISLDEYHRFVESGALEDARVELIGGLIVAMRPKSPEHERVIRWLNRWLFMHADLDRYEISVQGALTLSESEPEPDLALIEFGTPEPYHAATAALLIEVAVSSQRRDLVEKPPRYAEAGIPDYWVIDVDGRRAVHHSEPGRDGYANVREVEILTATALATSLPVADVLRDLP